MIFNLKVIPPKFTSVYRYGMANHKGFKFYSKMLFSSSFSDPEFLDKDMKQERTCSYFLYVPRVKP